MGLDHDLTMKLVDSTDNKPLINAVIRFVASFFLPLFIGIPVLLFLAEDNPATAMIFLIIVVVSYIFALAFSFAIRRKRPYETHPDAHHLKPAIYTYAFPSGHSTVAFAIASFFIFTGPWYIILVAILTAVLIAASRVITGLHYVGDIIAGAILGFLVSYIGFVTLIILIESGLIT